MVVVGYGVHALSNNNKDHHDDDDGGWLIVVLCNMHKHSHLAEGLRASTLIWLFFFVICASAEFSAHQIKILFLGGMDECCSFAACKNSGITTLLP